MLTHMRPLVGSWQLRALDHDESEWRLPGLDPQSPLFSNGGAQGRTSELRCRSRIGWTRRSELVSQVHRVAAFQTSLIAREAAQKRPRLWQREDLGDGKHRRTIECDSTGAISAHAARHRRIIVLRRRPVSTGAVPLLDLRTERTVAPFYDKDIHVVRRDFRAELQRKALLEEPLQHQPTLTQR